MKYLLIIMLLIPGCGFPTAGRDSIALTSDSRMVKRRCVSKGKVKARSLRTLKYKTKGKRGNVVLLKGKSNSYKLEGTVYKCY